MAELDPITNLPSKPKPTSFDFSNLKLDNAQVPSFVAAGDYGDYNRNISPYLSDTQRKEALSNNQGFWIGAGNSAMRVLGNIIPSTIQGFGYIEDIVTGTPDGNDVTDAMQQWVDSVNNQFPLYSDPSNKTFNWENISGLGTSVASFALTGMGVGGILGQLGRFGKVGQVAAQVGTAGVLTGIEGAMEANQLMKSEYTTTFNKLFADEIRNGKTQDEATVIAEQKAKEYVENAATKAYLTNYLNVALNLTSAGYFLKGANKFGRMIDPINKKNTLRSFATEGAQEALEEGVNVWAGATGKAKLDANVAGKGDDYTYSDIWNKVDKDELKTSMILGAIGGMGQTAISVGIGNLNTNWYKGKYAKLKEQYAEQKDFVDKVKQQFNDPKDISDVMLDITQTAARIKQAEDFRSAGNIDAAEQVEKDILSSQMFQAMKTGTWNDFKDVFKSFTQDRKSTGPNGEQIVTPTTPEMKEKATKALQLINQYESIYKRNQNIVSNDHPAFYQLYNNRVNNFHLQEEKNKENTKLDTLERTNSQIVDSINDDNNTAAQITNLRQALKDNARAQTEVGRRLADINKEAISNDQKYNDLLKVNEKDLTTKGKLAKAFSELKKNQSNAVLNAKDQTELERSLGNFRTKEEKDSALRDAAEVQNEQAPKTDFTTMESAIQSLDKRYENRPALQKVDGDIIRQNTGLNISTSEQIANEVINNNNEFINNYFDQKSSEAFKKIEEELREQEKQGVETVTAELPVEATDLVRNIDFAESTSDSEIPISQPKDHPHFDPRFELGQNLMNDPNNKLAGKAIHFEVENRKDESNTAIGINNGKILKGKEDSFEVLIVHYKDGNPNNKSKDNRVRLGKLRANTWVKNGTTYTLDPAFLRIRQEIMKSIDFTSDIYTLSESTIIKKIIPGKIHIRSAEEAFVSPKQLLKDGEQLILAVAINKDGNISLEYGDQTNIANRDIRIKDIQKIRPGTVFMLTKAPDGSYYPVKLFVKKLNDLSEAKKVEYKDKLNSILDKFTNEGNTKENRSSLYNEAKAISYVDFVYDSASLMFILRAKDRSLTSYITKEQLVDLMMSKLAQVDVKSINRGSYNDRLNNDGIIVSNLAVNRFTGSNIVMVAPKWGVDQKVEVPQQPTTKPDTVTFNSEEDFSSSEGVTKQELADRVGSDVADLLFGTQPPTPQTTQQIIDAVIDSWPISTTPQDDFPSEEFIYEEEEPEVETTLENNNREGINGIPQIIFTNPNFQLEGFEIDGNYWNVITSTNRAKVLININGIIVPFYLTTGQGGKGLIAGWYPFFGIGKDGWLNKTDKSDMETYYERYWGKETANVIKSISQELNNFYGTDPSIFKNDGDPKSKTKPLSTLSDKVDDYINSKLSYNPSNNDSEARKTLRSNIEKLGREIINNIETTTQVDSIEVKKADIERRRREEINKTDKQSGQLLKESTLSQNVIEQRKGINDFIDASKGLDINKDYNQIGEKLVGNTSFTDLRSDIQELLWEGKIEEALEKVGQTYEERVNAKYDAELAALEQSNQNSSNDLSMDAFDDIDNNTSTKKFRLQKTGDRIWNKDKEMRRLKRMLPEFVAIKVFEDLLEIGDNTAYGYYEQAVVHIFEKAEEGTGYHEAVHAIFNLLLNNKDKSKLLKEAESKFFPDGIPDSEYKYYSKIYPKLNKDQLKEIILEEQIAEEFKTYALVNEPKGGIFTTLFNRLKMWYNNVFGKGITLNNFYNYLNTGVYKKSKIKMKTSFSNPMFSIRKMNAVKKHRRLSAIKTIYAELMDELHTVEGFSDKTDVEIIKFLGKNGVDVLLSMITTKIVQQFQSSKLDNSLSETDKKYLNDEFTYLLRNFITDSNFRERIESPVMLNYLNNADKLVKVTVDVNSPLLMSFLMSLEDFGVSINISKDNFTFDTSNVNPEDIRIPEEENDSIIDDNELDRSSNELWQAKVYETRSDDSFSNEMKRILTTIKKVETDDLGFNTIEEYSEVRNWLFENISNIYDVEQMMDVLKEWSITKGFVNYIYNRALYDTKFKTDMFIYIASKSDDNYISAVRNKDGSVRIIRSNRVNIRNVIIDDLKNEFDKSKILNKDKTVNLKEALNFKDAIYNFNKDINDRRREDEFFDKQEIAVDVYLNVAKDFIVKRLADILKDYHIDISYDQLRAVANKGINAFDDLVGDKGLKSISNYLANGKNVFSLSDEKLSEGSLLEKIAAILVPVTVHKSEKSMNTVDNKTIFTHSYNNFAKELINKLKNKTTSELLIDNYMSTHFYEDSPFFKMLKDNTYSPSELSIDILDGVKDEFGKRFDVLTKPELEWLNIHSFFNQNRKFAYYRLPALSDSPQTAFLKFKKFDINDEFWNHVHSVVLQEYKRNQYLKEHPELIKEIDYVKKRISKPYILSPFMNSMKDIDPIANKEKVIEAAKKYFNDEFQNEINRLVDLGIINVDYTGKIESLKLDQNINKDNNIKDNLQQYFYNTLFMNTQLISVFSGDPIFYKSNNDWQKRNKQIWSPTLMLDISKMKDESKDENYHTITIKDFTSGSDSEFIKFIEKIFKDSKDKNDIIKKFSENNATDAQSFITMKRYKSIMKGLNRWTERHQQVYDKAINKELTANEVTEFYTDFWSTFSPLKPFDFHHLSSIKIGDEEYTFKLPYQTKRAELPILPQLIEDGQLKSMMLKAEQFEEINNTTVAINFESAVKVGGHNKYESIDEFINSTSQLKTTELSNRRYGFQVEVPEHYIETDNNFGSQIMKLIMADFPMTTIFTEEHIPNLNSIFSTEEISEGITFQKLINKYQDIIGQNIKSSFNELANSVKDRKSLKKLLWQNGLQNNLPSHYFEAIGDPKTNDDFELPLWFPGWGKKNEQILHSLLRNRVVKQKFPGASLVNVSSVGKSDLKPVYNSNTGALEYYEARLPWWVSSYFEPFLIKDGSGNLDIDMLKSVMGEKEADEILSIVAYRIPTEHKHSMFNIKIVGFTTGLNGGVIELPHEATTISGFDFDVDKLYAMFPAIKINKDNNGNVTSVEKEKYNHESLDNNDSTSGQRSNAILDIIRGILNHPVAAPQILKPSSFEHLKDISYRTYLTSKGNTEVLEIDKKTGKYLISFKEVKNMIEEESLDLALPSTQSEYIIRNSVGKTLIGFFANHNTSHAYSQHTNLEVKTTNKEEPGFSYRKYEIDENGKITYSDIIITETMLNKLNNINNNLISKELASFLAAATDNAKDPIASFMNLNTFTVDTFSYLLRLGFDPETIVMFMTQDSVENITNTFFKSSAGNAKTEAFNQYINFFDKTVFPRLIDQEFIHRKKSIHNFNKEELRKRLSEKADVKNEILEIDKLDKDIQKSNLEGNSVETERLRKIKDDKLNEHYNKYRNYYIDQYYVARTFQQYEKVASELGTLSTAIKVDNTSNRSSISDSIVIKEKFEDINSLQSLLNTSDFGELALIGAYYDYGLNEGIDLFSKIFPWMQHGFKTIRQNLAEIKGKRLTAQEMESINYHLLTFLSSGFEFFSSDKYNTVVENLPKNIDEYIDKNPNSSYIAFLNRFVPRERKAFDTLSFKTLEFYRTGLNNIDKQSLTDMWEAMLESDNATERKIASDLVYYAYAISGFTVGPLSFVDYIPTSFYLNLKDSNGTYFKDYMSNQVILLTDTANTYKDMFTQQYLQNTYSRSGSKFKILRRAIERQNINAVIMQMNLPGFLKIDNDNMKSSFTNKVMESDQTIYIPVNYIVYKHDNREFLFKYDGMNEEGVHFYKRTKTLGYKNYFVQYDINDSNPIIINRLEMLDPINNLVPPSMDAVLTSGTISENNTEDVVTEESSDQELIDEVKFDTGMDTDVKSMMDSDILNFLNTGEMSESKTDIYSKLGNKTKSSNIIIKPWGELKDVTRAITSEGIVSTRIKDNDNSHFGNPFTSDQAIINKGAKLILTNSTKESVEKYIDWVLTGRTGESVFDNNMPDPADLEFRREWILEQLQSGNLKDRPIFYYKELGEPSHATALDYLINKYDWTNSKEQSTIDEAPWYDTIKEKNKEIYDWYYENWNQLSETKKAMLLDELGISELADLATLNDTEENKGKLLTIKCKNI